MSALPNAFPIPPLEGNPSVLSENMRGVSAATHSSGRHRGLRIIPTRVKCSPTDFVALYHTYRRRIYSQCFIMLHNHVDAEDASQEVFLQLIRKAHTFRGESNFSTWLHRLTTNCVLMEIRRKRRRCVETPPREASIADSGGNTAMSETLDSFPARPIPVFEQIRLRTAISQLPIGYQRIFELHDVEGHTHEEIATLLGIQIGTSKSQLHKARLRMRGLLQNGKVTMTNHQLARRKTGC